MNLNKFFNSRSFYIGTSLILAILLFVYVNYDQLSNTNNLSDEKKTSLVANTSKTINTGLQISADNDKYFITGYPKNVKLTLDGPSALVTTTVNTQNFSVYADLKGLKPGKHTVKLQAEGLNKEISYKINPATIDVTIQKRKTATFPIQVKFNERRLAQGYKSGTPVLDNNTVSVSGASDDVNAISEVVAQVNMKSNQIKSTISQEVLLEALDADGKTLNVVVTPQTVGVTIPVESTKTTKKLSLNFVSSGSGVSGKTYKFSSDTKQVTVTGTKATLDSLSKIDVVVPINNIKDSVTKTLDIDLDKNNLISASPKSVKVKIDVSSGTAATSETTNSESTSEQASSSSDSSSESSESSASSAATSSDSTSESTNTLN
ncbi:CdaR family protein [Dellaglioa carnosa]|uniref:CdaR family protein n=1 Tax=Dellaglioa carnosa TaxID=2995136 RepID=A0ABT4JLW0_9LACO|nr:CdaR family protein [Dellaglioa carnosa]MCZ2490623.1 CdaR family protein [Dellaglioa carnosa]MCZ2492252.1 CdaR family protein [Dellaglioa carnosa]MCZ2493701.1 CdaR family protein [Dellaglioa carnosa]MDK1730565.1 CdaR family protein [Dellaglioa carnosa]